MASRSRGGGGQGGGQRSGNGGVGVLAFSPLSVIKGVLAGYVTVAVASTAIASAHSAGMWPELLVTGGWLQAINLLAAAVGGWYAGRKARQKGFLNGGVAGLLFAISALWLVGAGLDGLAGANLPAVALRLLLVTGVAALGGVVGVNL